MVKSLFKVSTPPEVIKALKDNLNLGVILLKNQESVNLEQALDRILSEEVVVTDSLPGFNRSVMDGYALKAEDSYGISDSLPAYFKIIGEVKMGSKSELKVQAGEVVRISTGGMLPEGTNAVIMLEYTEQLDDATLEIKKSVAPWENVIKEDEDLKVGEVILKEGHRLRPQDLGALAGIGRTKIKVYKQPKVAIISTGNEIIPAQNKPDLGQVRDINSYVLGSSVEKVGGIPVYKGIIRDQIYLLEEKIKEAIYKDKVEIVTISGGSSVGVRDITLEVLNKLGKPGVLVHKVAIKPGKPTIVAVVETTPIFGLPGHPVSAMIIFNLFVVPLINWLQGGGYNYYFPKEIEAELTCNVVSDPGREDYIRVLVYQKGKKFYAQPIWGKSGLISTLVRASGLIKIGLNKEGIEKGTKVIVKLF